MVIGTAKPDLGRVVAIARQGLLEQFGDRFSFDPVLAGWFPDSDGEERVHLIVVYMAHGEDPYPLWTVGLADYVMEHLPEEEVLQPPLSRFIDKSEWKGRMREKAERWIREG